MEKHSGILNQPAGELKFQLARHLPAPDLAAFVERYWIISWDLRGQAPHVQETLPNACVNLVIEPGNSRIYGVPRAKSARRLEEAGRVIGVKFRPGGFYPFARFPMTRLTGRSVPLQEIFDVDSRALEDAVLSGGDDDQMVALTEAFLRPRLPERDESVELVNQVVDRIIDDREITQVEELVSRPHISKRALQRLFRQSVGVSPKWVIQCYRLQQAAARLAAGGATDWSRMALDLGYFDQAHFSKDFKAMVGRSPVEYARSVSQVLS